MRALPFVALVSLAVPARAAVFNVSTVDELRAHTTLAAGDEVVLAAGNYDLASSYFSITATGSAEQPVIIRSADGARARLFRDNTLQDMLNVQGSTHLIVRGLEIEGGVRGVRIISSDHVTIENCVIHGVDDTGINVNTAGATTAESTSDGIIIRGNEVYDTGRGGQLAHGIFVGSADGQVTAPGAIIELNYIHDLPVSASAGAACIRAGQGPNMVIRDNVMHDGKYEGVLLIGDTSGTVVERNAIFDVDEGIVMTLGATVRNNVVIAASFNGLVSRSTATVDPGDNVVANNTVVVSNTALRVVPAVGLTEVYNNAVFGAEAIRLSAAAGDATFVGNIGSGTLVGLDGSLPSGGALADAFVNVLADGSALNAYPKSGSALIAAGDAAHQPVDDYNGRARTGTNDAGAYVFAASGNPGATIAAGFKTLPPPPSTDDGGPAGSDDDGGAPGDGDVSAGDPSGGDSSGGTVTDEDAGGEPFDTPPVGDSSGCAAALAVWPVMLGFGVWLSRRRPQRTPGDA